MLECFTKWVPCGAHFFSMIKNEKMKKYYPARIVLTVTIIFSLFACGQTASVSPVKKINTEISTAEFILPGNIDKHWLLLTSALERTNVPVVDKEAAPYTIKTDWVRFKYDKKNKTASVVDHNAWLSDLARERHRFDLSLQSDPVTGRTLIQIAHTLRQVQTDLAADGAVSYLEWRRRSVVVGSTEAFLNIILDAVMASHLLTSKSVSLINKNLLISNKQHQKKTKNRLQASVSQSVLWNALQASLKHHDIKFSVDNSEKTIDTQWTTLVWNDKEQQLALPADKEPIWMLDSDGFGIQQYRFNLRVTEEKDQVSNVVALHVDWREQYDSTPDASITLLKWAKKEVDEKIAEAFLKLLSAELSKSIIEKE